MNYFIKYKSNQNLYGSYKNCLTFFIFVKIDEHKNSFVYFTELNNVKASNLTNKIK